MRTVKVHSLFRVTTSLENLEAWNCQGVEKIFREKLWKGGTSGKLVMSIWKTTQVETHCLGQTVGFASYYENLVSIT